MKITLTLDPETLRLLRGLTRIERRPIEEQAHIIFAQAVRREDHARRRLQAAEKRQDAARMQ